MTTDPRFTLAAGLLRLARQHNVDVRVRDAAKEAA